MHLGRVRGDGADLFLHGPRRAEGLTQALRRDAQKRALEPQRIATINAIGQELQNAGQNNHCVMLKSLDNASKTCHRHLEEVQNQKGEA